MFNITSLQDNIVRVCHKLCYRGWWFLLLAVLLPITVLAQTKAHQVTLSPESRRVALVIGNDNYQNVEKLRNAANDANAMARELRDVGFEVLLHSNLDRRGMRVAVRNFAKRIEGGGVGVFYFSGHGMQTKSGINLLLPVDLMIPSDEKLLIDDAIALNDIMDDLREAKARFVLAVIDACRDNPFRNTRARSVGTTRGLAPVSAPEGVMMVFAAGAGQQALDSLGTDDPVQNGLFTREFITAMRQPNLPVYDLVKQVQKRVSEKAQAVGHVQRPAIYNEASDDFIFRLIVETAAATAAETVQQLNQQQTAANAAQEEARFWQEVKSLNTGDGYRDYLDKYPQGRYATLAKGYIGKLAAVPVVTPVAVAAPAAIPGTENTGETRPAPGKKQRPGKPVPSAPAIYDGHPNGSVIRDCPDCPEMVVLPPGKFLMGSPETESGRYGDEGPQHPVSIAKFMVSKYEITLQEWEACTKAGGCSGKASNSAGAARMPVVGISYADAQEYTRWLSGLTGKSYRLLTEAEWEYAVRGGTTSPYYWGNDFDSSKAYIGTGVVAVGRYPANAFGLYDMHGNALEWVEDCWHDNYTGAPGDGSAWMNDCVRGGEFKGGRVIRGGAGFFMSKNQRAARRVRDGMMVRNSNAIGLRVARNLP